jgi:hypothetical protein
MLKANRENLVELLIDFYNNNTLDEETECKVLNFLEGLGVDIETEL